MFLNTLNKSLDTRVTDTASGNVKNKTTNVSSIERGGRMARDSRFHSKPYTKTNRHDDARALTTEIVLYLYGRIVRRRIAVGRGAGERVRYQVVREPRGHCQTETVWWIAVERDRNG